MRRRWQQQHTTHTPEDEHDYTWVGFNPDVCLVKDPRAVQGRSTAPPREQKGLNWLGLVRRLANLVR